MVKSQKIWSPLSMHNLDSCCFSTCVLRMQWIISCSRRLCSHQKYFRSSCGILTVGQIWYATLPLGSWDIYIWDNWFSSASKLNCDVHHKLSSTSTSLSSCLKPYPISVHVENSHLMLTLSSYNYPINLNQLTVPLYGPPWPHFSTIIIDKDLLILSQLDYLWLLNSFFQFMFSFQFFLQGSTGT